MIRRITIDLNFRHTSMYGLCIEASVRNGPGDLVTREDLPREPTEKDFADAARIALDRLVSIMYGAGWLLP